MSYQFGFGNDDFGLDDFELAPPLTRALQPLGSEPDIHILFVGADAELAETYRLKLTLDGYRTSVVTTPSEARKLASALKPNLIYLDLTSAAGWGLKVLSGIRHNAASRSTPVLLLVKFPWRTKPTLGPHDFLVPVRLAFDQLWSASRRRRPQL
jgi:hypothetical protein